MKKRSGRFLNWVDPRSELVLKIVADVQSNFSEKTGMKTIRWQWWLAITIWCIASNLFGQVPDEETIRRIANRIPPSERFLFCQQMIGGIVHRFDLENDADIRTLDQLADTWTNWLNKSQKDPASNKEWTELVLLANTISSKQNDFPIVVATEGYLRLTAFALPIATVRARHLETVYSQWNTNKSNVEAWGGLQTIMACDIDSSKSPEIAELVSRRTEQLYSSPSPQHWNGLLYLGNDVKWSTSESAVVGEKFQIDRGVQRVMAAIDNNSEVERAMARDLGRKYWRTQASDDATSRSNFFEFLSRIMGTKRLETVVTFVIRDKQGKPTTATIAYHPKDVTDVSKTEETTLKILCGKYRVWSERNNVVSSDSREHSIFGETCRVTILETK